MDDHKTNSESGPKQGRLSIKPKPRLGNFLYYLGLTTLIGGLGAAIGYYAGAYGIRWLPTMLQILLSVCIVSLFLIVAGRLTEGSARKHTEKGLKVRRRVVFCISLVSLLIVARLAVFWTQQACPLTSLPPEQFNEVFISDMDNYKQYDKAIDQYLVTLEDYSNRFGPDKDRILTPDEERLLRDIWLGMYNYAVAIDQIRIFYEDWYRFDPSRAQASFHQRSFLLTFAAELSLYEKSMRFIKLVSEYPNVVKFLNTPFPDNHLGKGSYNNFTRQFQGARDSSRVLAGKHYLTWMETALKGRQVAKDNNCTWLMEKVKLQLALIGEESTVDLASMSVKSDLQILKQAAGRIWYPAQKGVASLMGNTRVRRIGKYLITYDQQEEMDKHLMPGDILVSRKNWFLSNVGLPGFWPHAILYIGSVDKFDEYFTDAQVSQWLKEVTGNDITLSDYLQSRFPTRWKRYTIGSENHPYRVIESCKYGVILNTLPKACGDYMAALRPKLTKKAKAQAIVEAFSHLDKPYDYNFDFATDHALVCTELVWRSYRPAQGKEGLTIPLKNIAGRKTLPANEIVKHYAVNKETDKSQFEFVYFLDAVENEGKTFVSTENALLDSYNRVKWSFAAE